MPAGNLPQLSPNGGLKCGIIADMTARRNSRTARGFAVLAGLMLLAGTAACSEDSGNSSDASGGSASQSSTAVTSSSNAESSSPSSAPSETEDSGPSPTVGSHASADCGVNTQARAIYDHISEVPLDQPNMYWKYNGDSNYNPCADLSYASVDQMPQGNGQFARQIMLFHKGEYLGVGSDHSLQHTDVFNTTNNSMTVRYKDSEAQDRAHADNAHSNLFTKDVDYVWDGSKVQMIGSVPGE